MPQPAEPSPPPSRRRRWPLVLLLLASLAWIGLTTGTGVGAKWLVPPGSGLASGAIALFYGLLGVAAGLLLGGFLAWRAPHGILRGATVVAVVVGLLIAGLVVRRVIFLRAERRAAAGMDVALPPSAGFRVESRIADSEEMRRYRELTVDAETWTATWIAVGPEAATCTATLIFEEADALLGKRTEVGGAGDRYGSDCVVPEVSATHFYSIRETAPGGLAWELATDASCLQRSDEVAELHWTLGRIPTAAVSHGRARCES